MRGEFGGQASGYWYSLAKAATLADVGRTTLHRAAVRGEIPYAVLGGTRYFEIRDIVSWAARRAAPPLIARLAETTGGTDDEQHGDT